MKNAKALYEEERSLLKEQIAFLESNYNQEKGWKNPEDKAKFDNMEADLKEYASKIELAKAYDEKKSRFSEDNDMMKDLKIEGDAEENKMSALEKYTGAFEKYMKEGGSVLNKEEKSILLTGRVDVKGTSPQTTSGTAGGYLVPEGWLNEVDLARQSIGSVRNAARILITQTGQTIPYPKIDDTAQDAELQTEGTAITVADFAVSKVDIGAFTFGTLAKFSYQIEQDNEVPLRMLLNDMFGERIARLENTYFTTGSGSSQPHGIVTVATEGPASGAATADTIAKNDVYALIHSVDPAYRYNPKSAFMFHDNVLKELKQISVGTGDSRPLWVPSFRQGEPDTIDGRPFFINQNMASDPDANGAKVMIYGDFNKFMIRQVGSGVVMQRLDQRFADELNVGYVAHLRADSRLTGPAGCIKYLYNPAT